MKNKIIYLQGSEANVLTDIEKIFEGYDKDPGTCKTTEDMKQFSAYWIGLIPIELNTETGEVISWSTDHHANLFIPEDFDDSIFTTKRSEPNNTVHIYR